MGRSQVLRAGLKDMETELETRLFSIHLPDLLLRRMVISSSLTQETTVFDACRSGVKHQQWPAMARQATLMDQPARRSLMVRLVSPSTRAATSTSLTATTIASE